MINRLNQWIWEDNNHYYFKVVLRIIFRLIEGVSQEGIRTRAQALAYTTILSIVPFFAVSFSVLKSFGVHKEVIPMLEKLFKALGEQNSEIITLLITFVDNVNVGILGAIGFLILFYTALSLIVTIESAFNTNWHLKQGRKFIERVSYYLVVILIGPVVIFSVMSVLSSALISKIFKLNVSPMISFVFGQGMTITVLTLFISIMYLFITHTKVRLIPALIGGLFAAIGWVLLGKIFTQFIASSAQYSGIYSGFAGVILFLLWLYLTWLIILLGNQLTYWIQHIEKLKDPINDEVLPTKIDLNLTLELNDEFGKDWVVSVTPKEK